MRKTTLREVKMLRLLRHENIVDLKEAFRRNRKLVGFGGPKNSCCRLVLQLTNASSTQLLAIHINYVNALPPTPTPP